MFDKYFDSGAAWGIISAIGTGFAGWLFGRRRNNAEASVTEIQAVQNALKIWRETAEALQKQIADQQIELDRIKSEVRQLEEGMFSLRGRNKELESHVSSLSAQNAAFKKKLASFTHEKKPGRPRKTEGQ